MQIAKIFCKFLDTIHFYLNKATSMLINNIVIVFLYVLISIVAGCLIHIITLFKKLSIKNITIL